MRRYVIVGGADIGDYEAVSRRLKDDDFFVFCDCGLKHAEKLGVRPDLIIGDFDSFKRPETDIEIIDLPVVKDDTDTVFAMKEGLRRGFDDYLLVGVFGGRLDHTLCNISILLKLRLEGKNAIAYDDRGEISVLVNETVKISPDCRFFSLINFTGRAGNITVTGAKYNLENAGIPCDYQYGVSNEVLPGGQASVTVTDGELLLIKIY